jgi:hypothetical protein
MTKLGQAYFEFETASKAQTAILTCHPWISLDMDFGNGQHELILEAVFAIAFSVCNCLDPYPFYHLVLSLFRYPHGFESWTLLLLSLATLYTDGMSLFRDPGTPFYLSLADLFGGYKRHSSGTSILGNGVLQKCTISVTASKLEYRTSQPCGPAQCNDLPRLVVDRKSGTP